MKLIVYLVFCIFVVSGSPAQYDQRQEGNLNVHAKLKNLYLVILVPSVESPKPPASSDEFDLFPSVLEQLLEFKRDQTRNEINESEKNTNILAFDKDLKHKRDSHNDDTQSHDQNINKNKEFKETKISEYSNNNEQVTDYVESELLGDGIENCGPERFRDRFGICQFVSSLKN